MTHTYKTTCLILCRPTLHCQNASDLLRHGLHKRCAAVTGMKDLAADPEIPVTCEVEPLCIRRACPTDTQLDKHLRPEMQAFQRILPRASHLLCWLDFFTWSVKMWFVRHTHLFLLLNSPILILKMLTLSVFTVDQDLTFWSSDHHWALALFLPSTVQA